VSVARTTRSRWTDGAIQAELSARRAELGHFPTRSELVARGLRGLWDAMRSTGGIESWQARLDGSRSPSHDEIAARAYELYERGVAGDCVAHWLAAEQQLA
jgi:predicted NBD/HSP70 family sugar kinase